MKMVYRARIFLHDSDNALVSTFRGHFRKWAWRKMLWRCAFPRLAIETTDACNANCIHCPIHRRATKHGLMSRELYTKIVDECAQYDTGDLLLSNYGEPLLDPLLVQRIRYAKEKGIPCVHFSTNGSLLNENISKELIESGLDGIYISLDAARKETYEKVRLGLDFDSIVTNIERFVALRNSRGFDKPCVHVSFVKMNHQKKVELHEFIARWCRKVDTIDINFLSTRGGAIPTSPNYSLSYKKRRPCNLWNRLDVFSNGDVSVCCQDVFGQIIVGNLQRSTIYEIWNGEKMEALRKLQLTEQYDKIPICRDCNAWANPQTPWWW